MNDQLLQATAFGLDLIEQAFSAARERCCSQSSIDYSYCGHVFYHLPPLARAVADAALSPTEAAAKFAVEAGDATGAETFSFFCQACGAAS